MPSVSFVESFSGRPGLIYAGLINYIEDNDFNGTKNHATRASGAFSSLRLLRFLGKRYRTSSTGLVNSHVAEPATQTSHDPNQKGDRQVNKDV